MIEFIWDSHAQKLLNNFDHFETYWLDLMDGIADGLAEGALKTMRPLTVGKSTYYLGGEHLSKSLMSHINRSSGGFEITFTGLQHGWYMDKGNWPASEIRYRSSGKPWPVGASRPGVSEDDISFLYGIHGMGNNPANGPTDFSNVTAKELSGNLHKYTDQCINEFLVRLLK